MKLIPLLLAALSGLTLAAESPAPESVPKGLASSDWSSIRAAYEAGRHAIQRQENGTFTARNPGQQWRTEFDGKGFLTTPNHGQWTWGLELISYGGRTLLSASSPITHEGNKISNPRDTHLTEWFINDTRGLEQGWTISSRSVGILPTSSPLTLNLALRGNLHPQVSPDSSSVAFQTPSGSTALTYGGLKAWDADGKNLPVHFEPAGETAIRIAVEDQNARYPITIDPIAQQAFLKAGNNGGPSDDNFGCSVAISGDTVVVGANQEDSDTTGVNSPPNDSASDSGAAYVFIRSGATWSQQAYLKASNTGVGDKFGGSVAVSGDTVVVGAFYEDSATTGVNSTPNENAGASGAAYVFTRSGTTWSQQAYLKASNTGYLDYFGYSVAVSGDTVVVGAHNEDSSTTGVNSPPNESAPDSGAAYIFTRSGTTWSQQVYLKASNTGAGDNFGISVAVSGDSVIVGAYAEDSGTTGVNSTPNESAQRSGAAYVFTLSGTTWTQQAYLKASNTDAEDFFGSSVAVSGDTVVVGASSEDSSTTGVNSTPNESAKDSGAAYIFTRSGTTWSQQAYLKANVTVSGDSFGNSVAVSGDTVVVGAYGEDSSTTGVNSTPDQRADFSGAAYIFTRSGTTWSQQAYLKASNNGANLTFGTSVAVSGDTVVVGANGEDSSTTGVNSSPNESAPNSGAAYVYTRSGTAWSEQAYLKASNTPSGTGIGDNFGDSVAVSGDTVVIGADYEDSDTTGVNSMPNENGRDSGAAYVFIRSGATWVQQAYLKASNTGVGDYFGGSVAVSGDTVVIGAMGEDSSTTGVNSTPNDNFEYSGAAYVFTRNGTTWSQQAYLKASNHESFQFFGISVAVSGNTVVVGAMGEDSSTTGANSTANESAYNSGAAYVFTRSGATWVQQAYLKASNTDDFDYFGGSVAVSGDTIVIGAPEEDSSTTGVNSTPNNHAIGSGAAYVFTRSEESWEQQAYLKANNTDQSDLFGASVSVSGDTVVVGAPREGGGPIGENTPESGAAYIFTRSGTTWSQQAYLKGSNPRYGDYFGGSVAVSGDTVVVGASDEDSRTPDEGTTDSGAAYVFTRSGTTWSRQAYLKASNPDYEDFFGLSVAVSGETVVVGAMGESSGTTGVNSTPNESAGASGAAYIFTGFNPAFP
jgi:FG-GAP repeat